MPIILGIFLSIWFLISVCAQFQSDKPINRINWLYSIGAVPAWTFFAPNPIRYDLALVVRSVDRDSRPLSAWQALVQPGGKSQWLLKCFWNPQSRVTKVLHDFANEVSLLESEGLIKVMPIELSVPYLGLLSCASDWAVANGVENFQFGLVEYLDGPESIIFNGFALLSHSHTV